MAVMLLAGGASAAQAAPEDGDVSTQACRTVSGGTWCTGTEYLPPLKHCYSNYRHNTKYHSATSIMGPYATTRYAQAGNWAKTSIWDETLATCQTYYNV